MKDEFFLELTNKSNRKVFIKGSAIVGITQKENYSAVFVNSDTIPFEVKEDAQYILDLIAKAVRYIK